MKKTGWIFLCCWLIIPVLLFLDPTIVKSNEVPGKEAAAPAENNGDTPIMKVVALERKSLQRLRGNMLLEEERLKTIRNEIGERLLELKDIMKKLEEEHGRLTTEREKEMNHLVKVYEAMTPEEAAPLVEKLNQKISVELLYRMKDKKAGRILEFVEKNKAVQISEDLAQRKLAIKPDGINVQ